LRNLQYEKQKKKTAMKAALRPDIRKRGNPGIITSVVTVIA